MGSLLAKMTNHSYIYQVLTTNNDQIKVLKIEKYSVFEIDFWHKKMSLSFFDF